MVRRSRLGRAVVLHLDLPKGWSCYVRRGLLASSGWFFSASPGFLPSFNETRIEPKPLRLAAVLKAQEPPRVMCGRRVNVERRHRLNLVFLRHRACSF